MALDTEKIARYLESAEWNLEQAIKVGDYRATQAHAQVSIAAAQSHPGSDQSRRQRRRRRSARITFGSRHRSPQLAPAFACRRLGIMTQVAHGSAQQGRCWRFVFDITVGPAGIAYRCGKVSSSLVTPCGATPHTVRCCHGSRRPPPIAPSLPDVRCGRTPHRWLQLKSRQLLVDCE